MTCSLSIAAVISSLQCGGAERVMTTLCNVWSTRHRVAVFTFASPHEPPFFDLDPAVEHRPLDLAGPSSSLLHAAAANLRRIRHLRRTLRGWSPDVVVAFGDHTNVTALLASIGAPWPVVVSERVDPRMWTLRWPWPSIRRAAYRRADALVLVAEETRAWVPPGLASKVRVIGNPVALADAPTMQPRASAADTLQLVTVGRLVHQKGLDVLFHALAQLPDSGRGAWRLTIVGDGPDRDALRALADRLGIAARLHWVGRVPDPSTYVREADVFVLPSRFEGFPNALVEAMALGRAVIASDCRSGPRELIADGETGLLVPPEDVPALADAIARVWQDVSLRACLAAAATHVVHTWSAAAVSARWEALFDELLAGTARARG